MENEPPPGAVQEARVEYVSQSRPFFNAFGLVFEISGRVFGNAHGRYRRPSVSFKLSRCSRVLGYGSAQWGRRALDITGAENIRRAFTEHGESRNEHPDPPVLIRYNKRKREQQEPRSHKRVPYAAGHQSLLPMSTPTPTFDRSGGQRALQCMRDQAQVCAAVSTVPRAVGVIGSAIRAIHHMDLD